MYRLNRFAGKRRSSTKTECPVCRTVEYDGSTHCEGCGYKFSDTPVPLFEVRIMPVIALAVAVGLISALVVFLLGR